MNGKNGGNLDEIIERKKKRLEENIRVSIRGHIEFGNPNVVLFSEDTINDNGIRMTIDLMEKIFRIQGDIDKPEFHYKGENGDNVRKSVLIDLMIAILEQNGLKIRTCGNCGNYQDIQERFNRCSKMGAILVSSNSSCNGVFKESQWIPKEIPVSEEKKE